MLSAPGTTYTYDSEGNRLTATDTATGEVTRYDWDHRNRLTRVTVESAGGILLGEERYTYDALDRRIRVWTDLDGSGPGVATSFWTVYDGAHAHADFTDSGSLITRYLHGTHIDDIVARMAADGTVHWYLTDLLGTIRAITTTAGTVLNHTRYTSFGAVIAHTNPVHSDRFGFRAFTNTEMSILLSRTGTLVGLENQLGEHVDNEKFEEITLAYTTHQFSIALVRTHLTRPPFRKLWEKLFGPARPAPPKPKPASTKPPTEAPKPKTPPAKPPNTSAPAPVSPRPLTVSDGKWDWFFGRVKDKKDTLKPSRRSQQNLEDLRELGIEEEKGGREKLLELFEKALSGPTMADDATDYGRSIVRQVQVSEKGALDVVFLYRGGDMTAKPEVITIIPKLSKKR